MLWSVVEKTALAEAEVEYHDHVSDTNDLGPLSRLPRRRTPALAGADVVIWTTTPWTIPGNRAIAYGEKIEYAVYQVEDAGEAAIGPGARLVIGTALADAVKAQAKIADWRIVSTFVGTALAGTVCAHPFREIAEAEVTMIFRCRCCPPIT